MFIMKRNKLRRLMRMASLLVTVLQTAREFYKIFKQKDLLDKVNKQDKVHKQKEKAQR